MVDNPSLMLNEKGGIGTWDMEISLDFSNLKKAMISMLILSKFALVDLICQIWLK